MNSGLFLSVNNDLVDESTEAFGSYNMNQTFIWNYRLFCIVFIQFEFDVSIFLIYRLGVYMQCYPI